MHTKRQSTVGGLLLLLAVLAACSSGTDPEGPSIETADHLSVLSDGEPVGTIGENRSRWEAARWPS